MDALDTKTQRAYARTRSIAHTRPKAVKLALTDERRYRLAKGYG